MHVRGCINWSCYTIIVHAQATTDVEAGSEVEGEGGAGEKEGEPAEKKRKDPSLYTLVEAAQYGILGR